MAAEPGFFAGTGRDAGGTTLSLVGTVGGTGSAMMTGTDLGASATAGWGTGFEASTTIGWATAGFGAAAATGCGKGSLGASGGTDFGAAFTVAASFLTATGGFVAGFGADTLALGVVGFFGVVAIWETSFSNGGAEAQRGYAALQHMAAL